MSLRRINLNLDADLLAELDEYASRLHVNRSSAISIILSEAFDNKKALSNISEMTKILSSNDFEKLRQLALAAEASRSPNSHILD